MVGDLILCKKCAKETNKYSPYCEHCHEPLTPEEPAPSPASEAAGQPPQAGARTIAEQGRALGEALAKHSGRFMKKCPFCAEEILPDAVKCRYCGERIATPAGHAGKKAAILLSLLAAVGISAAFVLFSTGVIRLPAIGSFGGICKDKAGLLSDELKSDPAKAEYVKNYITLKDIGTLDEADSKYGTVKKYVYGTVRNSGNKLVIKLKVTVYYLDKSLSCIAEGSIWPVLGTKAKHDQLKPDSAKDFQVEIKNINPAWSRNIKAKVSDIEFLE